MANDAQAYNIAVIRNLLLASFGGEELSRFCQDRPPFQPILANFGPGYNLNRMVDEVVNYCQTHDLFAQLLTEVKGENSRQYARFEAHLPISEELAEIPCPYRGLKAFEAKDAEFYFGRTAMATQLVAKVKDQAFVAVVGPSGCGKSSLVQAGLIKMLNHGALPGSQDWAVPIFRPGPDPLRALAAPLVELLEPEAGAVAQLADARALAEHLRQGALSMADVAAWLREKRPNVPRVVLIADQFEELYTECRDEALRPHFVKALLSIAEQKNMTVVITLRADFYGRVLSDRALGQAVNAGQFNVLPMDEAELRAAIEQPALKAQRDFEPGLVESILGAVGGEPGNLPLLEFALTELWAHQEKGNLTHSAYKAIGQVPGALSSHAEKVYGMLEPRQQDLARRVFVQLVNPGQGTEDTRRVATRTEIGADNWSLVSWLATERLVVTSVGEDKQETVEIVHEALIRSWQRLRTWIDEDRPFRVWQEHFRIDLGRWLDSNKSDDALLSSYSLGVPKNWLDTRRGDLSEVEQEFIEASLEKRRWEQLQRQVAFAGGIAAVVIIAVLVIFSLSLLSAR